jgi:uncharacterized protein (DUF1778 family)
MASAVRKGQTLNFRVNEAEKAALLEAAAKMGEDITQFVVEPALARAREILDREQFTVISPEMRERFVQLTMSPAPPSASLMRRLADRRHRAIDA